jgi:hypothetical protein
LFFLLTTNLPLLLNPSLNQIFTKSAI